MVLPLPYPLIFDKWETGEAFGWGGFYDFHTIVQYGENRFFLKNELLPYWPLIDDYEPPTKYHKYLYNYNTFLLSVGKVPNGKFLFLETDDLRLLRQLPSLIFYADDMQPKSANVFGCEWKGFGRLAWVKRKLRRGENIW